MADGGAEERAKFTDEGYYMEGENERERDSLMRGGVGG